VPGDPLLTVPFNRLLNPHNGVEFGCAGADASLLERKIRCATTLFGLAVILDWLRGLLFDGLI